MIDPLLEQILDAARTYAHQAVPEVRIDLAVISDEVRISASWPLGARDVTAEERLAAALANQGVGPFEEAIDRLEKRVMPRHLYLATQGKALVDTDLDRRSPGDVGPIALRGRLWSGFLEETGLVANDKGEVTYRGVVVWRSQAH